MKSRCSIRVRLEWDNSSAGCAAAPDPPDLRNADADGHGMRIGQREYNLVVC